MVKSSGLVINLNMMLSNDSHDLAVEPFIGSDQLKKRRSEHLKVAVLSILPNVSQNKRRQDCAQNPGNSDSTNNTLCGDNFFVAKESNTTR